jgi:glycosyltransferase involved in cell wall biosynthesis
MPASENSVEPCEIRLSLIVPVYNRPSEIEELLESLSKQTVKDFEVIIVEDGSSIKCDDIVEKYKSSLNVRYYLNEKSGPGMCRNFGCRKAAGNYNVILDSDCIIPPHYVETVQKKLNDEYVDAFGGPDSVNDDFTDLQKAINYAMTSFFTTGGIRGGGEKMDKFHPRSFNMGFSKEVFEATGGFPRLRFAEDIDFTIRIMKCGFKTALIKDAYVYHKRRADLKKFFKQVSHFGIGRINLYKRYPETLKPVHVMPSLFVLGSVLLVVLSVFLSWFFILPLVFFTLLLFVDSLIRYKNLHISLLSVAACYIQLTGYGCGFLLSFWKVLICRDKKFTEYIDSF